MAVDRLIRNFLRSLPESDMKDRIRWAYYRIVYTALVHELSSLPVVYSGVDETTDTPFIRLRDGTILFGRRPTAFQRQMYSRWREMLAPALISDTIGVGIDAVSRYLYPHAMPHLSMPYPRRLRRRAFHRQHAETINDLPGLSKPQKKELREMFAPRRGEVFLDIGAYMGYGSLRMAQEIGPTGKVIALEPEPGNLSLLQRNVRRNRRDEILVVPKAAWSEPGELELLRSGRQANSLLEGVVEPAGRALVPTMTVDSLLQEIGVCHLDLISVTVNGAEVEVLEGMRRTLQRSERIRLSMAGWYERSGERICDIVLPTLEQLGLRVLVGRAGGVLAWRQPVARGD